LLAAGLNHDTYADLGFKIFLRDCWSFLGTFVSIHINFRERLV